MPNLEAILRQEIHSQGSISFARFMELALYCPEIGYYERDPSSVGKRGDFYTSVSVGPVFGEMLAQQFAAWMAEMGLPKAQIVEAGAHDGRLAADILRALECLPARAPFRYWIIEPSERRRNWQRANLDNFAGQVEWFASFAELPHAVEGVIFANEFLDAFPVHILQWRSRQWLELRVGFAGDRFVWVPAAPEVESELSVVPTELAAVLPEGFQIEICPAARQWWRASANQLARGKLVTFDYGLRNEEFLLPARAQGTLRAYHQHQLARDLLENPGEQDITAHVNFTALIEAGEAAGLRTQAFVSQSKFLAELVGQLANWSPERVRQFQTLTHPEHLGRAFKVLIQSRDATPVRSGSPTN